MNARVDFVGRIVIRTALRDALGFSAGTRVDASRHGSGLAVVPGRTAQLVHEDEQLVATEDTPIDDDVLLRLSDAGRR